MANKLARASLLALLFACARAQAIEYYELEVYGYQTAAARELEVENSTSFSSDDESRVDSRIVRSTLEFNYGISDRWEATAYLDYTKPADDNLEYTAFRAHARTRFYEKGEMPVDLGAYFEIALPRNFQQEDFAFEFRPIIEKDFSRWTIRLNPQVELSHSRAADEDDQVGATDADEVGVASSSAPPSQSPMGWRLEWGLASSLIYRLSDHFRPHLDWHVGFTDGSQLLMPAVDLRIAHGLSATLGFGWGLNAHTEQKIALARFEYEIYF
jgi:hypothetical protein